MRRLKLVEIVAQEFFLNRRLCINDLILHNLKWSRILKRKEDYYYKTVKKGELR